MIIDKFIDYKVMLLTVSITVFYLYITSNNNIILKKNVDKK